MCDYSAKAVKQRAARQDDVLVTKHISTHTRGFVSVIETDTAVCLLPGTQLAFNDDVRVLEPGFASFKHKVSRPYKVATFIQVDKNDQHTHHDALEFADGTRVKLTDLVEGQHVRVLQLPAAPKTRQEADYQRRAQYV